MSKKNWRSFAVGDFESKLNCFFFFSNKKDAITLFASTVRPQQIPRSVNVESANAGTSA